MLENYRIALTEVCLGKVLQFYVVGYSGKCEPAFNYPLYSQYCGPFESPSSPAFPSAVHIHGLKNGILHQKDRERKGASSCLLSCKSQDCEIDEFVKKIRDPCKASFTSAP